MNEMKNNDSGRPPALRFLVIITPEDVRKKLEAVLTSYRIPVFFQLRGKGTVPSKMIDMIGLGSVTRLVTVGVMLSGIVHELLRDLDREIQVSRKGRGIIFTIPVTGLQNPVLGLLRSSDRDYFEKEIGERVENDMAQVNEKGKYMAVIAVVNMGYSEDVMEVARGAGAKGGTVLKGLRSAGAAAASHFGISLKEEQEFVLMLVPRESKSAVMSGINTSYGLRSEAHGMIFSLPVDETVGLGQYE